MIVQETIRIKPMLEANDFAVTPKDMTRGASFIRSPRRRA
jgi:hypothetical protein